MLAYQIDLLKADGSRDCLLAISCARDLAAIVLAKSIFRFNRSRAARILVWRDDKLIFADSRLRALN